MQIHAVCGVGRDRTPKVLRKYSDRLHFSAFICLSLQTKKPENQRNSLIFRLLSGVGRDRTADTRIFSPLLYRLSYRTILVPNEERIANIGLKIK